MSQEKKETAVAEATAEPDAEATSDDTIVETPAAMLEESEEAPSEDVETAVSDVVVAEPEDIVADEQAETEVVSEDVAEEPQVVEAVAEDDQEESTTAEAEAEEAAAEALGEETETEEAEAEEAPAEMEPSTAEAEEAPPEEEKEEPEKKPKKRKRKKTPLSELKPGTEMSGRVVGIADFGAFVDVGAETDGLVHISELSEDRVKKVSDVVSVGQQVDVWIKDVDVEKERISLSMRPKPDYRLRDLKPGMVVDGVVTGIREYGVFVDIGSETEGLVHVSEMAEGYVDKPSQLVSVGEDVEVQVKKVDRRRRRISLSMKGLSPAAPPPPSEEESAAMPTAMELAMRRALGDLEEEIEETSPSEADVDVDDASRDELSGVFSRMLREYREDQADEA